LDLIQITDKADIPIAKIQDFGKLLYQEKQKHEKGKTKQKGGDNKTLRLRPNTSDHDIERNITRAKEFLEGNNKVTFIVQFRGRENAYPEKGKERLEKIKTELFEECKIESDISKKGKLMSLTLAPK